MTKWLVVYGETMPAWEKEFDTLKEACKFAQYHHRLGDQIYLIGPVVPGQVKSIMAAVKGARK